MTARDRLVLIGLSTVAVLAAVWILLVSPERQQATKLASQVSSASAQLSSAEEQLANARAAQARYADAYASIVRLGKAVPASEEVPSLIYQLSAASNKKNVDFSSIVAGSGPSPAASAPASPTAAGAAGFTQMPFTFIFAGGYGDLFHLFQSLNGYTVRTTSGGVHVSGRLLTVQSVKLSPLVTGNSNSGASSGKLTGTITATAYVLPAGQGLTGGATPASPGTGATPASSSAGSTSSSPSAPAIVRVGP